MESAEASVLESGADSLGANKALLFALTLQTAAPLRDMALVLLLWERPVVSALVAGTLLYIAWKDWVHLLPALAPFALAALMAANRRRLQGAPGCLDIHVHFSPPLPHKRAKMMIKVLTKSVGLLRSFNNALLKVHGLLGGHQPDVTGEAIQALCIAGTVMLLFMLVVPLRVAFAALTVAAFSAGPVLARKEAAAVKRTQGRGGGRLFELVVAARTWWLSVPAAPVVFSKEKHS